MLTNKALIEFTKEITIAKLSNSTIVVCKDGAEDVADFMQVIYDKLSELNKLES